MLWTPSPERIARSRLTAFRRWLEVERGLHLPTYDALWQWSVDDLQGFWSAVWTYFDVKADGDPSRVLGEARMPGARWFEDTRLNYAEHALAKLRASEPAILHRSELRPLGVLTGAEVEQKVRSVASGLRDLGVGVGDRVVAYLPNTPETVIAFLAAASLGATWSSCSPDFGTKSVVDRFRQIEPKILLTVDGYRYGGKGLDRRAASAEIQAALPSLTHTFEVAYLDPSRAPRAGARPFGELAGLENPPPLEAARVPFDHPLWVLYSSGTTGLPKAIVQGHGGILLEHLKVLAFHTEVGEGDRFFWFTTTGWMMWNYLVSGLLHGSAIVLFDGNPGHPDMGALWSLAEESGMTYFGTSASYISACMKSGIEPKSGYDLSRITGVGSTGSPLSSDGFQWVYDAVGRDLCLGSVSGGSDVCSAFVGSTVVLPVRAGEIQRRCLGVAMEAWDESGKPLIGEVGEMVITKPMPSMPTHFWGDDDHERYRKSYFDVYPGVWRHGDFVELTEEGSVVIYGRSDSTLNRHGVRIGTAEIYRAVESIPEIREALVVNLERPGGELFMPLFVSLAAGHALDEELKKRISQEIRTATSPRHVPDAIIAISEIPKTLNGKKMEIPVRKILAGQPVETAMSKDSCQNPGVLDELIPLAKALAAGAVP